MDASVLAHPGVRWTMTGLGLVHDWCTTGLRLVYNWSTTGLRLVYNWSTTGLRLAAAAAAAADKSHYT